MCIKIRRQLTSENLWIKQCIFSRVWVKVLCKCGSAATLYPGFTIQGAVALSSRHHQAQRLSRRGRPARLRLLSASSSHSCRGTATSDSAQRSVFTSERKLQVRPARRQRGREFRQASAVGHRTLRLSASESATRGDRSSSPRATRSVLGIGDARAQVSVCVY